MSHKFHRGLFVLAAAFMLFGTLTATAYANLDSEPVEFHGTTTTNPGAGQDHWWREGWGQSLYPNFALEPPEAMDYKFDGYIIGMLYSVDRNFSNCASGAAGDAIIDRATPDAYYRASFGGTTNNIGPYGTNTENTIDLLGIYANPPFGGWPPSDPDAAQPVEGQWYLHYRYIGSSRYSATVHTIAFGVDTTAPRPVDGMTIRTGLTSPPVTTWQPLTRAMITWTPEDYDPLAGVGYYEVLVDDQPIIPEKPSLPTQGRVYELSYLPRPSSITVENMPAGKHKLSIVTVDRATNSSVATSGYYYSDPDTPTIAFTAPASGFLNSKTMVSVDASDKAGDPVVVFKFDGVTTATVSAAPYDYRPDLAGVSSGTHIITATATDHLGRSATATKTVSTLAATSSGFQPDFTGALTTFMGGTSATHPNAGDAAWRRGWGNSVRPQFTLTVPSVVPSLTGDVIGMLYTMDKTPTTQIDIAHPENYFRSGHPGGTDLDETIDLQSIVSHPPAGGWPAPQPAENSATEGTWYMHFVLFTDQGYAGTFTRALYINMDVTAPRAVENLHASPTTNPADGGSWTDATRAHLTWTPKDYDDLSGVAYYQIYMDGSAVEPKDGGRVWEVDGMTPSSFTIENMPPGQHALSVAAVDRATNEGPRTSVLFSSDPDVPKITLLSPLNHKLTPRTLISVNTTDLGGDPSVAFRIDGVTTATVTSPPYSFRPDLSGMSAGVHTILVTATDHLGRTASVSTTASVASVGTGFAPSESDDLNGLIEVASTTNPNDPADETVWWRNAWGNTLSPQFDIASPSEVASEGFVVGMLYTIDRSEVTTIDISTPDPYARASRGTGTNLDTTIDLNGVMAFQPLLGLTDPLRGEVVRGEGIWFLHYSPFTSDGYASATTHNVRIGVDLTRPRPVNNLTVSPSLNPADSNIWVDSSRAHIRWSQGVYDDLSGVAYYQVYIDGEPVDDATQGHVFEIDGKTPTSYTIENMPAGRHKVSVTVVDRAGNESAVSDAYFMSDPDVPTITLLSPLNHKLTPRTLISVNATDLGGDPSVAFRIDGVTTATVTSPPYSFKPDLSGMSAGVHTILVTATDHLGRTASVSTTASVASVGTGFTPSESDELNGPIVGTSSTNPEDPASETVWWRNGWGNTLSPQFDIASPSEVAAEGFVVGMLYTIDRSQGTLIDISTPDPYARASRGTGTNLDTTIDLNGVMAFQPLLGLTDPLRGEVVRGEGIWFLHYSPFTSDGYASATTHNVRIGVDLTRPRPVNNLTVSPSLNPADSNIWVDSSRAHIRWSQGVYDDLSGVAYYQVYIDGEPVDDATQGHVFEIDGKTPTSYTIENMPAGRHKVSVTVVDRAGNESAVSDAYFMSDPDVPTITLLSPLNHKLTPRTLISVNATDLGGDPSVAFRIDGVTTATVTSPPYSFKPDLSGMSAGVHTILVTATDHLGRTASVTTTASLASIGTGFAPSEADELNGPIDGTSSTNPNDVADPGSWWRGAWGNTLSPQFDIAAPSEVASEGFVIGMLYTIDRSQGTLIDISTPDAYARASHGNGTNLSTTIDLAGVLQYPPLGGWPAAGPGEVVPGEGIWYFHFAPFTSDGYASATTHGYKIGVDLTRPRPVTSLVVSPSLRPSDAGAWVESSRAHITWAQGVYDDLSGVAYYQVYVDGIPVDDSEQGHVFEIAGKTPTSYTIEDMPAGKHKVSVSVVDRAGNESSLTSGYFYSDPDVPTIRFGSFNRKVGVHPTFNVEVDDLGGIGSVRYYLDGHLLGIQTDSPYNISPDLDGFSSGSHTLTATVYDQFGHTATINTTITLDKLPLTVTSFSRTPSIFYPIRHDGYYDTSKLKFKLNKAASVTLTIRRSSGATVRTIKKSGVSGTNSMSWDGKWSSDNKAHTGTFTYQLTAVDAVGNKKSSVKLSTTIRNYQLVRTSGSRIKVVPR